MQQLLLAELVDHTISDIRWLGGGVDSDQRQDADDHRVCSNPLAVTVGTTVTWTNNDSIAHDSVADNGLWNSGILGPGQSFQFRFATAGTFTYKCTIHPNMVGTVTVQ
jgi:plastocyanin